MHRQVHLHGGLSSEQLLFHGCSAVLQDSLQAPYPRCHPLPLLLLASVLPAVVLVYLCSNGAHKLRS